MQKLDLETPDGAALNIEKIAEAFPEAVAEGKVNFDALRTLLGDEVFGDEAYEFTWVGKRDAIREAGRPIRKTLRPCVEESKNWDTTENLYIEGDNLDVLKLLQESYLGKVKMIYIDPPYNTGYDFVYRDDFAQSRDEYEDEAGVYDEDDNRLFRNTETNGRFHSDWCSMMYPRLVLARNMLSDDGVIFISIDDGEVAQLREICDEIFGQSNFVSSIIWEKRYSPQNAVQWFSEAHDFILVYAKHKEAWQPNLLDRTEEMDARYKNPDNDPRGDWKPADATAQAGHGTASQFYELITPSGQTFQPPTGRCWVYTKERMQEMIDDSRVWFGSDGKSVPAIKRFLTEVKQGMACQTIWKYADVGHNQEGKKEIKILFPEGVPFDTPKPTRLIRRVIQLSTCSENGDVVLDFFSGSATTAHAVMQLNAEDGGKRKFIMVQLPEPCDEKSEAFKAGYSNICEIGKERIRRAGDKIAAELAEANQQLQLSTEELDSATNAQNDRVVKGGEIPGQARDDVGAQDNVGTRDDGAPLDIGFRVLKLDDTNMKDVYYSAGEYDQGSLDAMISNIKDDRTDLDLLYGCLIDWGLPLSLPHTHEEIDGVTVHTYNNGDLIACFADTVSEAVVREIASRQPLRAVFRDSSFSSSPEKINVEEIFKLLAPNTSVRVI